METQVEIKNNEKLRTVKQVAEIKYLLLVNGFKQIDIANDLKISQSAVSHVINGRQKGSRIDFWLKKNLGLEL